MKITLGETKRIIRQALREAGGRMRSKLFPGEKTTKVPPEDLVIGDMIVMRAWGVDDIEPWLMQVRSVRDPGYAIVVGLNTDRGFQQKDLPYDQEVEIVERNDD